jgi:drug/metabolite transporter (DMT)-like permease
VKGVAILFIVLANIIGGSSYLAQKLALEGLPPATVTLLRNVVAMACLLLFSLRGGGLRLRFSAADQKRLALLGLLAYALPLWLGIIGLRWSTAGNGSVLILLEPPAILLFSRILLGESIRPLQALGLLAGLAGALCIVLEQAPLGGLLEHEHLRGNLVLALHGLLWGLYSPAMQPLAQRLRAVDITFMSMTWACAALVPAALLEHAQWHGGPTLVPALQWTVALGVVASFGGTFLWNLSLRHLRASVIAPFVFLQPLSGVVAGHLVLDETLTRDAMLGGALIGLAVVLVIWPVRRAEAPSG